MMYNIMYDDMASVARRATISIAPGKGAERPQPGVGTRDGKPARVAGDVRGYGGQPRGTMNDD